MNLIEQLGGYDKAKTKKDQINSTLENSELLGGGDAKEGLYERLESIEQALLEYRRQHNIFEVGDKVFYTGRANDNDLYTIKETYAGHDFVVGDNGADKNFWTLFLEEIRHADDAEIKVGKRLEVNQ